MSSANASNHLPHLPPRRPDSHKGDFGRALLIGGSQGMAGAIALAGMAALRSGAGLVKIATPSACQTTVAGFEAQHMTIRPALRQPGADRAGGPRRHRGSRQRSNRRGLRTGPGAQRRIGRAGRLALSEPAAADGRRCRCAQRAGATIRRCSCRRRRTANPHAASRRIRPTDRARKNRAARARARWRKSSPSAPAPSWCSKVITP